MLVANKANKDEEREKENLTSESWLGNPAERRDGTSAGRTPHIQTAPGGGSGYRDMRCGVSHGRVVR